MVINVPVIADVDVLMTGGSVRAVRAAAALAAKKFSVFCAIPRNYCGEGPGSTLDFHAAMPDLELFPRFPKELPTPMDLKRKLEHLLTDAEIPFFYRCFPVRRIEDENGNFAGMVLACRSGLVAVRAKVLLDGSFRRWSSTIAGAPAREFVPGDYTVERILVGAPPPKSSNLDVTQLKPGFSFGGEYYPVFRASAPFWFKNGSWQEICRVECEMRQLCWAPEQVFAPDSCTFTLPSSLSPEFTPSVIHPFVTDADGALEMLKVCHPGKKCVIPGEGGKYDYAVVRFDNAPRYKNCEKISFRLNSIPFSGRSQVIVAGGGTGGAPAALGAARSSAEVLCLESACHLGGLTTQGRIGSYWFGNRRGYSCELDKCVAEMGENNERYPAEGRKWNVEWKQHHYLRAALRGGVKVLFNTIAVGALRRGDLVCGVVTAAPDGCRIWEGAAVIDATGNADVAAAAGAACEFADPLEPALQGSGVSRANPGVGYANCDYCFTVDSDTCDATSAWVRGREKYSSEFDIAAVLGTRERRRIKGDLQLKPEDFLLGRTYHDTIVDAVSNFDTHGFTVHGLFLLKATSEAPLTAKVPYRALLPAGLDGILVTGLGISAHRDAMPVVRMENDVQNQGFAAGLAAGMTAIRNVTVRRVDMLELKRMLCSIGNLPESVLYEQDGYDPEQADPEFAEFAAAFRDPAESMPRLCEKLKATGDPDIAALMAFLKNDSGRKILADAVSAAQWDEGWEYKGMGQFGPAASHLDAWIIALSKIAGAEDGRAVLKLLKELEPAAAFSHFRAVCLLLQSAPCKEAVSDLERLLSAPELTGSVECSFKEIIEKNSQDPCDNFQRTCQLKELYLLKALALCDPESALARERLEKYASSPSWLYAACCTGKR